MSQLKNYANKFLDKLPNHLANRIKNLFLPQPSRFHQYMGEGEILTVTDYFNMIVPGWDLSLTPAILTTGSWEPELSDYLRKRVRPGMITFDVGANMGWYSCLFASCGAFVHAFEPNPRLQRILKKNIFMNAEVFTPNCAVNQCAISNYKGVEPMRFPHWLLGGAGLHNFDQSPFLDSLIDEEVNTDVTTIDDYARKMNIERVDLIKVDIEGHEESAILGAAEIISRSPDLTLSLEFNKGNYSGSFPSWLFERFSEAYLPALNCKADLNFLHEYMAGTVLTERSSIDIVFHAR